MFVVKVYLLSRLTSLPAWIGFILFGLELVLHLGNVSMLMLVFAVLLVVTPQERIERQFREWTQAIKDSVQ